MISTLAAAALAVTVSPEDFGTVDGVDDDVQIQAALDALPAVGGKLVLAQNHEYSLSKTVWVTNHNMEFDGNGATLQHYGDGPTIGGAFRNGGNYPVNVRMRDLIIAVYQDGASGLQTSFSHSSFTNVAVVLFGDDQIGVHVRGDPNGHGPYHNVLTSCRVQGYRHIGRVGQRGFVFTSDPSYPSRGPNANVIIGGRVGQVDVAYTILGGTNILIGTASEGLTNADHYYIDGNVPYGAINTTIIGPHIENKTGDTGSVFFIGPNASGTQIINPYITGAANTATIYDDHGLRTSIDGIRTIAEVSGPTPPVHSLRTLKLLGADLHGFVGGRNGQHLTVLLTEQTIIHEDSSFHLSRCNGECCRRANSRIDCVFDGAAWFCQ
jgi:hypothetical protein